MPHGVGVQRGKSNSREKHAGAGLSRKKRQIQRTKVAKRKRAAVPRRHDVPLYKEYSQQQVKT